MENNENTTAVNEQVENQQIDNQLENEQENENENASENNAAEETTDAEKEKPEENDKEITVPEEYDYSEIELPEGMELDKDMLGEFNAVAKEEKLSQEQANKYINLAVKLVEKQSKGLAEQYQQAQQAKIASYQQALNTDEEIGGGDKSKMDAYLNVADFGYNKFATDGLKQAFANEGLNYHPEVIKLFHKLGELCKEDDLPNVSTPAGKEQSAAEILYGSKE